MVFSLRVNITSHGTGCGGTHRECRIPLLPCESAIEIVFGPAGRVLLQIAKHIRNAMDRPETSQQMNVIFHSTDSFGYPVHPLDDSTEVSMKIRLPISLDEGS